MGVLKTGCLDSESGFLLLNTNILEAKDYIYYEYKLNPYIQTKRNEKQSLLFFFTAYVYLRLRGEYLHELIHIMLLSKVALHLHKVEGF